MFMFLSLHTHISICVTYLINTYFTVVLVIKTQGLNENLKRLLCLHRTLRLPLTHFRMILTSYQHPLWNPWVSSWTFSSIVLSRLGTSTDTEFNLTCKNLWKVNSSEFWRSAVRMIWDLKLRAPHTGAVHSASYTPSCIRCDLKCHTR